MLIIIIVILNGTLHQADTTSMVKDLFISFRSAITCMLSIIPSFQILDGNFLHFQLICRIRSILIHHRFFIFQKFSSFIQPRLDSPVL